MFTPQEKGHMALAINIRVQQSPYDGGGSLNVNQELYVRASDFMEVAQILGQFHALAERIKREQDAPHP